MRCPNCGHENVDPEAVFCSRCAAPLGAEDSEATTELDADAAALPGADPAPTTTEFEQQAPYTEPVPPAPEAETVPEPGQEETAPPVRERVAASWLDVTAAASIAFLVLLCTGGVLLLGAKMQYPALGTGANAIEVLSAIAILALATLRAPIH